MAALQDVDKASLLARRGRQFSEIEELLHAYYVFYDQQQDIIAGRESTMFKFLEELMKRKFSPEHQLEFFKEFNKRKFVALNKIFMDAINNRDSKKIMEIAHAVEFLRFFDEKRGDRYRADILSFKLFLDKKGEHWTIRKLAEKIKWPQSSSADGLSQLRRICHELNFPLEPSRKISRK